MNRMFGTAKPKAPKPTLEDASKKLEARGEGLDEKIRKLDAELARYTQQMRTMKPGAAKNGVKQRAMRVLKQKKMYEQQREQMANQAFNMDQVSFATETLKDTVTTVGAMKDANKALKQEFKKIDIGQVEDMQDDMADLLEQADEIQDVLGRSYNLDEVDDQDLEDELAALEDDPSLFESYGAEADTGLEAEGTPDYLALPTPGTEAPETSTKTQGEAQPAL